MRVLHIYDLHSFSFGATAAWHAMLVMLHGVTSVPATSRGLENLMPSLRARRAAGMVVYTTVL